MKALLKYLFVCLVCLPVFFINIKSSYDWGDDYAQYLLQAKNITEGNLHAKTEYIYNPQFPVLGPPSYPAGFPILLAPVYGVFGNSISHFNLYISFFLFSFGILLFHFLHKYYSFLFSILLVIIFLYNPWTLQFKTEVMSDIPFALFLLLCVILYQKSGPLSLFQNILLALLTGFLISIRNIGVVFILAVLLETLRDIYFHRLEIKQRKFNYKTLVPTLIITLGGFFTYILLNKIIFSISGDGLFSYHYLLDAEQLSQVINTNLHCSMGVLRGFFEPWNDDWQFVAFFSGTMIFAFIMLGMIKKMSERFDFIDGFVLIYFAVIIVYDYSSPGFRFLLPLTPFLLYYLVQGILSINIKLKIKTSVLALGMAIFVLLSYQKGISVIFEWEKSILEGPQEPESIEAFNYIINNTPDTSRFVFIKPRALALYTNRPAMSNHPRQLITEIHQSLISYNIQYMLINTAISGDSIKHYVKQHENEWTPIWSNPKYFLYKRNTISDIIK